jgi:hypothetical protein
MSYMSDIHLCATQGYGHWTHEAHDWPLWDTEGSLPHIDYIAAMTIAYVECALWATDDTEGRPMKDLPLPISESEWEAVALACSHFYTHNAADLLGHDPWANDPGQAGHDFYLTRNNHGAGFWDRNRTGTPGGNAGARLTQASITYGEVWPLVADDGTITGLSYPVTYATPAEYFAARKQRIDKQPTTDMTRS